MPRNPDSLTYAAPCGSRGAFVFQGVSSSGINACIEVGGSPRFVVVKRGGGLIPERALRRALRTSRCVAHVHYDIYTFVYLFVIIPIIHM